MPVKESLRKIMISTLGMGRVFYYQTKRLVMKKKMIGIIALSLIVSTSVFAQDAMAKKTTKSKYTSIGPVVGMGHSWVSGMTNTFKPSAYLGAGILYSRYEHWGFGGLLTASHEGYSKEVYRFGNTYVNTIDPTYLRFTPRAYYFFGDYGNNVRPKIYAGPSVAYKVVEDQYIEEPRGFYELTYTRPTGEVFNSWDFGVNAGAGVNIKVAKYMWLNLDADYYHGLLNVTNADNKNRTLRANAGLMIGI